MQAVSDIQDIVQILFGAGNSVLGNTMTIGLWYLIDMIQPKILSMLTSTFPVEILNPIAGYGNTFMKLWLFHHVALK